MNKFSRQSLLLRSFLSAEVFTSASCSKVTTILSTFIPGVNVARERGGSLGTPRDRHVLGRRFDSESGLRYLALALNIKQALRRRHDCTVY